MRRIERKYKFSQSRAGKEKRKRMKNIIVKGMHIDNERQCTNFIYAHGELQDIWEYDLVTVFKFGCLLDDVEDGIYNAKFICPNNEVVKAKVFVWTGERNGTKTWKKGLVVKVGDDKYMRDAQAKYDNKECYI